MTSNIFAGLFGSPGGPPEQHGIIPVRRGDTWGELLIDGSANGAAFTFELDTGACDLCFCLKHRDRLGLRAADVKFSGRFMSPGGGGRSARIRLRELRLDGGFVVAGVDAVMNETDYLGETPLLGRSVLRLLNFSYVRGCAALSF
jgi:clan AA aspartic protease (TIGR02281 family)